MLITIYGSSGVTKAEVSPNDSSTQSKEIQGDNILSLSFTHYSYIPLDVNDYVDFEGERYWLTEQYKPKQKSTVEWEYNLKLYGIESLIKRFLVLMTADNANEPVFTLTAPPAEHVRMIVKCINDGMGHITDWKMGRVDGTDNITIDYEGLYCDEALKQLAEKVGVEWWMEGTTVNLCRCEHGEEITLGYDHGLVEIDKTLADNVKFYTRLFPVGSSRNIDPSIYGASRLQLPGGEKFVELNADKYGIIDHYESDAFSDIYPRRTGVVSSVRSERVKGEDGEYFNIYYFSDDSLTFDPNDYEIANLVKRVSFQEGSELAGLGDEEDGTYYFECNFNSSTREFEIITIWPFDDDTQLPGESLIPKIGDKYILWNIRMPEEYYELAEEEFMSAVQQYNSEHCIDVSVYKCPTDHVWVEENGAELYVGRRVRLLSEQYFPATGKRSSRITKITRKVNLPGKMDIEISDALSKGKMDKLSGDIASTKSYVKTMSEGSSMPDIIRSSDNTVPTDNNIFSARRSGQEHLSKKRRDRAKEAIIFEKGLEIGDYDAGEAGGIIDGSGNAELLSLVVRAMLRSPSFAHGFTGEGWRLWMEEGLSHLELDKLTVRQVMTVFELVINKIRSVGGQMIISAANGKIQDVEDQGTHYHISFEGDNMFAESDLMRCQTFTGGNLKGYWVRVEHSDSTGIDVLKSEFAGAQPAPGDECVLMGNETNPLRQNLISISATEDGQPRIDVLDKVCGKTFEGCLRARFGSLEGINDDWFPLDKQPQGYGIYSDNAYLRGTFLLLTGEDVLTKFEIVEGKIESSVEGLRQDFTEDKGFLSNPTFGSGMEAWDTLNEAVFFLAGNRWIWANDNVLTKKGYSASVVKDGGRTVVRIRNRYISQSNSNLRYKPVFATNSEGNKEAVPVYLTFFYRCAKGGVLKVEFQNVDKTGFENFNSLSLEDTLSPTEGYQKYTCNGLWNGTGDFKLSFTGEIYLYMLILTTDRVESLTYKYRTLFEQSDRLVKFSAQALDSNGNILESSEILTTSKYNQLMSQYFDEHGALVDTSYLVTTTDFEDWFSQYVEDYGLLDNEGVLAQIMAKINDGTIMTVEAFAGMFAAAVSADGNIVKSADIALFVTSDEVGNLISNAHIRADQITLEGLVLTNRIVAGEQDGQRVEINPENKAVEIYNSDGGICTIFEGESYNGASELFGDTSGAVSLKTRSSTRYGYSSGITWGRGTVSQMSGNVPSALSETLQISESWYTDAACEVSGSASFKGSANSTHTKSSSSSGTGNVPISPAINNAASLIIYVRVSTYSDSALTSRIASSNLCGIALDSCASAQYIPEGETTVSDPKNADKTVSGSVQCPAGYHVLEVYIYQCTYGTGYCSGEWGATATSRKDISATFKSDFYVSRYFANGFCLGMRNDNYVTVYNSGANGMRFIAENGGKGFQVTENGIKALRNGGWMPLPIPVFSAKVGTTSSAATIASCLSFDGSVPTVSRTDTGTAKITFPTAWQSIGISEYNCFAIVQGASSKMKGTLLELASESMTIQISDDASLNDDQFAWVMLYFRR